LQRNLQSKGVDPPGLGKKRLSKNVRVTERSFREKKKRKKMGDAPPLAVKKTPRERALELKLKSWRNESANILT